MLSEAGIVKMRKYNPAIKPVPLGGDYRPHYRKSEVDEHLSYLDKIIDAQAATIGMLRAQKTQVEIQLSNTLKMWKDQVQGK